MGWRVAELVLFGCLFYSPVHGLSVTLEQPQNTSLTFTTGSAASITCSYNLGTDEFPLSFEWSRTPSWSSTPEKLYRFSFASNKEYLYTGFDTRQDVAFANNKDAMRNTLNITSLQAADEGNYTCTVTLDSASSTSSQPPAAIVVNVAPTLEEPEAKMLSSSSYRLNCTATGGRPAPSLKWYRGSDAVNISTNSSSVTVTSEGEGLTHVESVIDVTEDSDVTYTCSMNHVALTSATNKTINPRAAAEITVTPEPETHGVINVTLAASTTVGYKLDNYTSGAQDRHHHGYSISYLLVPLTVMTILSMTV